MPSIKADTWIKRMALEHGMIDAIVERKHLKETVSTLLSHM